MHSLLDPRATTALLTLALLGACTDSTAPASSAEARLRVVNSVFQGASAATATPVSIDVLVDSSTSAPGAVTALAPVSITSGTSGAQGANGGYTPLSAGVHSFIARVTGSSNPTLYTSTATTTFLPTQALTPFPFTLVVAGIAPPSGLPAPTAVPYVMLTDDPFSPPADTAHGGLTARLHVINAAPFTVSSGAGNPIKATFAGPSGTLTATAAYRASSSYINPPAGTYTLSITTTVGTTTTVLYSGTVVLGAGEVRTFVVQSTGYSATPGPANTKVTDLLDNKF